MWRTLRLKCFREVFRDNSDLLSPSHRKTNFSRVGSGGAANNRYYTSRFPLLVWHAVLANFLSHALWNGAWWCFPRFYSLIGFVHEFRPIDASQVQELLENDGRPSASPPRTNDSLPEVIASLIRMSGGNFRLLTRLLAHIERVLSVNDLHVISTAVVEAARDSLVISPANGDIRQIIFEATRQAVARA